MMEPFSGVEKSTIEHLKARFVEISKRKDPNRLVAYLSRNILFSHEYIGDAAALKRDSGSSPGLPGWSLAWAARTALGPRTSSCNARTWIKVRGSAERTSYGTVMAGAFRRMPRH